MKRRQALTLSLAAPWALAGTATAAPAQPGQPVAWPATTALLDGTALAGADLQGRAAVVVFWSTTCPFCRRHNQHLEKLHRAAQGLPLTVMGVARERDAAVVRRYAQQQGYSFPITLDHAPWAAALSERKIIPLTAVVDRQGRLKQVLPGEMFEEDLLELLQLARAGARS